MMVALTTSDGISALALVVALVALYRQVRKERRDERDSRKAQVVAYFQGDRLYIHNQGNATARAIRVEVDGQPIHDLAHSVFNRDETIASLAPGSSFAYVLLTEAFFAQGKPRQVRTRWLDDSLEPGVCTSTLGRN